MDTSTTAIKPPTWYWLVAALALIWMLFGVMAWTADFMMTQETVAQMSEAQRQLYDTRPQWIFVVYGIAIFSGLAGAIALLVRKSWAVAAFAVSLVAVIVQFGYTFGVMKAVQLLGAAVALPFPVVIFAIGAALLWLARYAKRVGWLD